MDARMQGGMRGTVVVLLLAGCLLPPQLAARTVPRAARDVVEAGFRDPLPASVLRGAPSGIGIVENRVLVSVNDYVTNLTGYGRDELLGQPARMLYPTAVDHVYSGQELVRQIREQGHGSVETRWRHKDGRILHVLLSSATADTEAEKSRRIFTVLDVTRFRQATAALDERTRILVVSLTVFLVLLLLLVGLLARSLRLRKRAEAAIAGKAAELDRFFLAARDLLCIADMRGNFIRINNEWSAILGYGMEVLGHRTFFDLIHAGDVAAARAVFARLEKGDPVPDFTNRVRCKDGSCRFVEWRAISRAGLLYAVARDITERKKIEDDLAENRRLLADLIENSGTLIFVKNREGVYRLVNRKWEEMTGLGRENVLGATDAALFPPATARQFRENDLRVIESGTVQEVEETLETAAGPRSYLSIKFPLRDARNAVVGVCGVITDITSRKMAEAALEETNDKLGALFAAMTEMVALHEVVFDAGGRPVDYRIIDCNAAYTAITGIAREDAIGRLASDVYGTAEAPYLAEFCRVGMTGEAHHFETYYAPMGKYFSISVVSPGANRFATVTNDVTGIKQVQQLVEAKNRELEQLVYVASHDLRSPLVNVDGYSRELEFTMEKLMRIIGGDETAEDGLDGFIRAELPGMARALFRIRNSTRQMDALLNGLLKLSRSGRAVLAIAPLDMDRLLAQVLSSFEFQARQGGVAIEAGGVPPCIGDEVQLTQVFSNLVGNALKYLSPERPGVIRISGEACGNRAVYRVADNGIGIAPAHQEKIFELFHRLDPDIGEGEGLGLTIVRQILGRLDGEVRVEAETGVGSCFIVSLPLARLPANPV